MITELRTAVYAVIAIALFVLALALFAPMSAGAQAPQARCRPGALLAAKTTPPTYARCVDGFWRAISEKDYLRLAAAQQARQALIRRGR